MSVTPNDDIVEISQRCDFLRTALRDAPDDVKIIPERKYSYLCEMSGERPNLVFLRFSQGTYGGSLDLHRSYLSQRAFLPILFTLPLCPWLEHINLREERLTTTLIQLLCEALQDLPCLTTIDVSGNPFGSFGVQALLRLVQRNRSIVDCRVDGVQCVGAFLRRLHMACERNMEDAELSEDESFRSSSTPSAVEFTV
ncbi:hypothetical protein DQ04_00111280 [Trypanosoma grayi]|uniref:hypothetical protein n=1 Tax=Trypanosoma grayi TaxID=71804 RepID=UPI0004F47EDF|nr:hypothetical protein DQ04_00111280 [Trypanosoma grayi]KEG15328.1 hypothetical protein DQ04_00111280 [Trypanosoma grayi]